MLAERHRLLAVALMLIFSVTLVACGSSAATSSPVAATASSAESTPSAVGASSAPSPSAAGSVQNAVMISGHAFSPATLTVPVGTKVTWTNQDPTNHTVSADDGKTFDSGPIATGATFSFTFTTAATFAYHCNIHPSMTAKVIVTP